MVLDEVFERHSVWRGNGSGNVCDGADAQRRPRRRTCRRYSRTSTITPPALSLVGTSWARMQKDTLALLQAKDAEIAAPSSKQIGDLTQGGCAKGGDQWR